MKIELANYICLRIYNLFKKVIPLPSKAGR